MDVIGTKNLRLFLPAMPVTFTDLNSPCGFLVLEISTATAGVGGGLALFTLSLCLPLKVALFFLLFSSLRNTKIMPRNLNEILLSRISSLVSRRFSYSDAMNKLMSPLLKLPFSSANTGRIPLGTKRKERPRKRKGW